MSSSLHLELSHRSLTYICNAGTSASAALPISYCRAAPRAQVSPPGIVCTVGGIFAMKDFEHLTEQEVLALAITAEEEDERFYADVVESVRQNFTAFVKVFEG